VTAQVNCLYAALFAAKCLLMDMLATSQSNWTNCIQCDLGPFSWSMTPSQERSECD